MIIDSQVHLFEPNTPAKPWPGDPGRGEPRIPSFSAERMIGAMDAIGVDRAVIVPPVWAGDHNDTAFEAASAYPGRFKIMGRIDPFAPDTSERLETWLQQPAMLGIRMSTRLGARAESFTDMLEVSMLGGFWDACERLGIPVMCLTRHAVRHLGPVAAAHPNLRLVVDHMSTLDAPDVSGAFAHIEELLALARHANVNVKVSTAPNHSRQQYPFEDVQPIIRRVYDAFGASRMMWAADITQLTKNTYAECLRLWQEGIPFLSASDRDRILGLTAADVLRWPA